MGAASAAFRNALARAGSQGGRRRSSAFRASPPPSRARRAASASPMRRWWPGTARAWRWWTATRRRCAGSASRRRQWARCWTDLRAGPGQHAPLAFVLALSPWPVPPLRLWVIKRTVRPGSM